MAKTKTTSKDQNKQSVATRSKKRKPQGKSKHSHRKQRTRRQVNIENRPLLEPDAAVIDIGAREIYVAVPPDRDEHPVRVFDSFTGDLNELADWLTACGVTAACFVSWLALCPDNDISGGRVLGRGARKAHNRAGQLFRMAAYSLDRSATPLGGFPCAG